jgi:hypothetical protein
MKIILSQFKNVVLCCVQLCKKILSTLLLAVYLFAATDTHELLKFPFLVKHYYEHKLDNKNLTVVNFIVMHYHAEDGTDKDAAKDKKLPFKSPQHAATAGFISFTPTTFFQIEKPEKETSLAYALTKNVFCTSRYLAAIWQPPRTC